MLADAIPNGGTQRVLGAAAAVLRPHQLDLLRRTVAKDLTREEFDLFIEAAQRNGLDPFRRQIMPLIFSKDSSEKRRMVIIVGIDGQRMIAQRSGNYRPASEPTRFVYNSRRRGATNPLGLVLARVTLFQQDNKGDWFPVVGEAYWDELAPIRDEWEEDPISSRRRPTGRQILDQASHWVRMPRLMLAKCATMQALRAGWPNQFGGLYTEEELDLAKLLDQAASEIVDRAREESRLHAAAGKDSVTVTWGGADWVLENVPLGEFADRVRAWIEAPGRLPSDIQGWAEANREALRLFWAKSPTDALALKKVLETRSVTQAATSPAAPAPPAVPAHVSQPTSLAKGARSNVLETEPQPPRLAAFAREEA